MQFLVLGAGISGLGAAIHLPPDSVKVLEADGEIGGISRSRIVGEFLFDRVGQFLHIRDARAQAIFDRYLPGTLGRHERNAAIYIAGRYVPHPFQAHIGWLPPDLRRDCELGFMEAVARRDALSPDDAPNLLDWFRRAFGEGITRHFLEPQNRKSYCCDLTEISAGWVSAYIPQPSVAQVMDGARSGGAKEQLGYNASFYYPRSGGIQQIPAALASNLRDVRCGQRVTVVEPARRRVTCADGSQHSYENLISTIPLNDFVALTRGLPPEIYAAARGLRSTDVLDIALGVTGEARVPYHWIYFPESRFPFARVVLSSNVSDSAAPRGKSVIHIETNCPSGASLDADALAHAGFSALKELGIVAPDSRIEARFADRISGAYVLHDHHRETALPLIQAALAAHGIRSVGRYGGWGYGGIETALLAGIEAARTFQ
jgi:protoporphyrinogen oxidase